MNKAVSICPKQDKINKLVCKRYVNLKQCSNVSLGEVQVTLMGKRYSQEVEK